MKPIDYYINVILYNTINKILVLFNRSIRADTFSKVLNNKSHFREWKIKKDYFVITYNKIAKTNNKNIYRILEQKTLFKYKFKKK